MQLMPFAKQKVVFKPALALYRSQLRAMVDRLVLWSFIFQASLQLRRKLN